MPIIATGKADRRRLRDIGVPMFLKRCNDLAKDTPSIEELDDT
jgi:hypothetical protein